MSVDPTGDSVRANISMHEGWSEEDRPAFDYWKKKKFGTPGKDSDSGPNFHAFKKELAEGHEKHIEENDKIAP